MAELTPLEKAERNVEACERTLDLLQELRLRDTDLHRLVAKQLVCWDDEVLRLT